MRNSPFPGGFTNLILVVCWLWFKTKVDASSWEQELVFAALFGSIFKRAGLFCRAEVSSAEQVNPLGKLLFVLMVI